MTVLLSILSAALFGAADFLCGLSARGFSTLRVLLYSQIVGGVLAIALAPVLGPGLPALADLGWGALAGLAGLSGLAFLYTGLAKGRVAIVSPLSALVSALIPALYGALTGERPGIFALVGAALCIPAILLLAWESEGADRPVRRSADDSTDQAPRDTKTGPASARTRLSLALGTTAGAFLGCFYIFISKCAKDSGLWPLAGARMASLFVLAWIFALRRPAGPGKRPKPDDGIPKTGPGRRAARVAALAGGFLDISANFAFLYASRTGLLMIVSVVTSLYPAPTVILARVFLKEKLPPRRMAGLALALAGIVLVGLKA